MFRRVTDPSAPDHADPTAQRIEATRSLPAAPHEVFAVLSDPPGHVDMDASGMLMEAEGEPVSAVGDRFLVQMGRSCARATGPS